MLRRVFLGGIPWLLLLGLLPSGCRGKRDAAADAGGEAVVTAPSGIEAGVMPAERPGVAGAWVDEIGDAPWREVVLTATGEGRGTFVGRPACVAEPCPAADEGEYELDGIRLTLRTRRVDGDSFEVHIGGDVMEWRKNEVMQRRFRRVPPPRPVPPDPTAGRYPPECARPAAGTPCEKMTAAGCLWSAECVLEALGRDAAGAPYRCRLAVAPCEGGVAQGDDGFEEDCRARQGCTFRPSECFCPSARTEVQPAPGSEEADRVGRVSCTCGGGPYRQCLPEASDSPDAAPDASPDT